MALLKSVHGGNTREAAALLGIAAQQLLDFSANINPLGMPESVRRRLSIILPCAERYPDVEYQQLHSAGGTPPYSRIVGPGWQWRNRIDFTLVHGLKPRTAMIVKPGFAEYRRALQTVDCTLREFALREEDGWQLTDAILAALTPELDCLFLCTPNNPTGLLPERPLLEAIAARCRAPASRLFLMKRLSILFPTSRDLSPFCSTTRISGCCARSPNFMPFPACVWAIWLTATNGRWPDCAKQMPWSINAFAALAGK
jgi:threonine-phosphate decarboxylase